VKIHHINAVYKSTFINSTTVSTTNFISVSKPKLNYKNILKKIFSVERFNTIGCVL